MTEQQIKQAVEGNILIALFNAISEHSEMLEGTFKQREKQIFKNWKNIGDKVIKSFGYSEESQEYLDSITDVIHEAMDIVRKNTYKQIDKDEK